MSSMRQAEVEIRMKAFQAWHYHPDHQHRVQALEHHGSYQERGIVEITTIKRLWSWSGHQAHHQDQGQTDPSNALFDDHLILGGSQTISP